MRFFQPSVLFSVFVTIPITFFFSVLAVIAGVLETPFRHQFQSEGRWGPVTTLMKEWWAICILAAHGIKIVVSGPGAHSVKNKRGVVFVANHQSALDIPVVVKTLHAHSSFVAKQELRKIPIFGWAAEVSGVLFIDRARGTNNQSLQVVSERLRKGLPIIIYPEGTRSSDGQLLKFKRGAFVIAIEAQASIVPVVIFDSRLLMPKHRLSVAAGRIHVWIGDEVSTRGMNLEDRQTLTDKIQDIIAKQLENFDKNRKNG